MTHPRKELTVACSYLLRLMKAHVELSTDQINVFKRTFHDVLSKRFIGHWFPATPHRGSAYRCLQTKHWKDPVLKSIAERSCLPLHRYLPVMFTIWIDPGEVAICFGDEGTWCPLYNHDTNGETHQTYSDGEETVSSSVSDDNLSSLTENVKTLKIGNNQISSNPLTTQTTDSRSSSSLASNSRPSSPFLNTISTNMNTPMQNMNDCNYLKSNMYPSQFVSNDWNAQQNTFWPQQRVPISDGLFQ